jgi:glycosyltransferase involved in cell wall biosynthesis
MKITLCLLTWNEISGCKHDVPLIKRNEFEAIYAIDGGSTDGTIEYLKSQGIKVYKQKVRGLNMAHIEAVKKCKTDAIIFFHPKGTIPVVNTTKFRKYFNQGHELIIASRMIRGSTNEEDDQLFRPRKWLSLCLAWLIALLWKREGETVRDILHGFRGVTKQAFYKIDPPRYGLTIDFAGVVQAYKKRIKRKEFPVKELPRTAGQSHFKIVPVGKQIIRYMYRELFSGRKKI